MANSASTSSPAPAPAPARPRTTAPAALHFRFIAIILVAIGGISLAILYGSNPSFFNPNRKFFIGRFTPPESAENRLERILKKASMENRTVIITVLNYPWAAPNSLLDLFIKSFRTGIHTRGLLRHLVIVALDQRAFTRCLLIHAHCFALATEGVDFSEEAYFVGPEYLKMMWTRIAFLRHVLELGYNFVFTDTDIMWFRNPFQHFFDEDFQIACDRYRGNTSDRVHNAPNGGFTFVRSNNCSIEFYKYWFSARERYPGLHDQDVLNKIKNRRYIDRIGLTMRFLSTAHFGGFCEPSKDLNEVCTMHANCCVGLDAKLHDLRILMKDWKHYKSLPMNLTSSASWTVPRKCQVPAGSLKKGKRGHKETISLAYRY